MVETNNQKPRWFFYPAWAVSSILSITVAWVIAVAIMSQIVLVVGGRIEVGGQTHITEDFLFLYVFLPVLALLTGFLQYLLLRSCLPRMGWWIAATVLGWVLFAVVLFLSRPFTADLPPALTFVLAAVFIGGSIGLFQWLLLRRRVDRAVCWILSSGIGWAVALLLTDGAISSVQEVLSVVVLPPVAGSIAWWLLLDKLPQRKRNGGNSLRSTLQLS